MTTDDYVMLHTQCAAQCALARSHTNTHSHGHATHTHTRNAKYCVRVVLVNAGVCVRGKSVHESRVKTTNKL